MNDCYVNQNVQYINKSAVYGSSTTRKGVNSYIDDALHEFLLICQTIQTNIDPLIPIPPEPCSFLLAFQVVSGRKGHTRLALVSLLNESHNVAL